MTNYLVAADTYKHLFSIAPVNANDGSYSFCSPAFTDYRDSLYDYDHHHCDDCPFLDDSHNNCVASSNNPHYQSIIDHLLTTSPESLL